MTKKILSSLLILQIILASGCKDYTSASIEQLEKYIEDSSSNSFHIWYLEKEGSSFYYLKRKTGLASFDYFKLHKDDVTIKVGQELPRQLQFGDIYINK